MVLLNRTFQKGIKEIADEHNVDENFLNEFASTVKAQAEKEIDAKIAEKLKPLQDEDNAKKVDDIFNKNFDRVLENLPEFKDVANKAVIKTLALDPANKIKLLLKLLKRLMVTLSKEKDDRIFYP